MKTPTNHTPPEGYQLFEPTKRKSDGWVNLTEILAIHGTNYKAFRHSFDARHYLRFLSKLGKGFEESSIVKVDKRGQYYCHPDHVFGFWICLDEMVRKEFYTYLKNENGPIEWTYQTDHWEDGTERLVIILYPVSGVHPLDQLWSEILKSSKDSEENGWPRLRVLFQYVEAPNNPSKQL